MKKLQKALQVSSMANTVIRKHNDINMKHMAKMLKTGVHG